ncbi:hybrid sensor histidine kinase/response regulator transcription factor [Maribacter luteus]|uniref:histidine kinase n=1 Tax=Maribacter luteus TaxID=2594478 RepID=A0A6I2MPJ8_9FLAO|nr:hybrid sensor histidine kinase/response regulator transcription factor [Maribacter luteus]MRX64782.1 response regulator [Maribacter luteus]
MKSFTTIFLLLFGLTFGYGQSVPYRFKNLNTSNGLSQSSVIAIEQDSLGRMWLGTRDGLNLYDGNEFKVFRNDLNDSTSISNSDILAITEDTNGYIWIGTYNGLNRYDPKKGIFKRYFHSIDKNSLGNNTIWAITEIQNGEIWIGTSNGLSIYNKISDSFTTLYADDDSDTSLPSNYVLSIVEGKNGSIWVGTSKGFCKVTRDSNAQVGFQCLSPHNRQDELFVQVIASCQENILCIGTKNMGMLKFDIASEHFLTNQSLVEDDDIRAITKSNQGEVWVGTSKGITLINDIGEIQKLVYKPYENGSLSHDYIKSLFTDKKGSIWIGSYYGGVDIWDKSNTNFINYGEMSSIYKLGHKVVSSIVSDKSNQVYFGTEGGGVTIIDNVGQNIRYLNASNSNTLLTDNVKSLLINENRLWIGSFDKGVEIYDIARKKFDKKLLSKEFRSLFFNTGIYAIKEGKDREMWIGTFGEGLAKYDLSNSNLKVFKNDPENSKTLSSNRIRCLIIDKKDNVWVGTQTGLNLIPFNNGAYKDDDIIHFFYDKITESGDDILTIFQDSSNVIWVGIRAKGLFRFNGETFERIPIRSGKKVTSIYAILEDDDHALWMSSNQGLLRLIPKSGVFNIYTENDGLIGNEFSSGAALKIDGSKFYFGGPAGVSFFNPKILAHNDFVPQVILTDFKIKNKSVSPKDNNGILEQTAPFTKEIELEYDMANFSIDFAIPNFINPSSNQYQYRMVGLDENWTTTNQTKANFTIQNPGNYIFEVKGANNDGIWNSTGTKLRIKVKPAPWRSAWAFALYGILILSALLGLGHIIRSRTKLKHKLQLEYLEGQRNQEINDAKLRFFTNISHEFRTPLTLITGPLQQLLSDYNGSSFVYKKLLVIESNANHLLQLINRLMDFRKLEHNHFKLETAKGNIVKFSREIYLSFSEFAKSNGYEYTFLVDKDPILVYYDRPKLEQVFYNLISNAFKYTPKNGTIAIEISKDEKNITIDVKDSGPGIPIEYREKVFDRFFEIPEYTKTKKGQGTGTGIGLSIAKSIMDLHKGSISVLENPDNGGSIFRITLPLGKSHLSEDEIIKDFKFSDDVGLYTSQLKHPIPQTPLIANELLVDLEKETILLVEDNVPLRTFMKDLLKDNYNVIEAGDGEEALKKALKYVPSLIVSDVIMPVMVGTELCAKVKENLKTSHIPVILLTSRTSLLYKFEGLESGADDYISKPFNVREFQLRVKNLIDSSKRLRNKFSDDKSFSPNEIVISSVDEQLLKKALQIIEDNIANDQFDIPTFSSELGVSRTLLFTKIKAWTNFTPNEFVQEIRMKRAADLLEQDKLNISQISYQVGFKNPKYFSKCFTKKYGISPSSYADKFSTNSLD